MRKKKSRSLRLDTTTQSTDPNKPIFLAKPPGAPAYYGFPLIEATRMDGFCFGAITDFEDPEGCRQGDGFVEAPDGSRAGLVWEVGEGEISQISPPDENRWGVWAVWFPKPVRNIEDQIFNFYHVLPALKEIYFFNVRDKKHK